jgi:excisionase family DNA binding protein
MELLLAEEVAELLRVSPNRVILMARRGEIPAVNVFGKLRFNAAEVEEWLRQNHLKWRNKNQNDDH